MATLACDINASVRWNRQSNDGDTARPVVDANTLVLIDALTDGTGVGQADVIYHAQLTVTGTPTTLDLTDGTLKDMLGNACVFDYMRTIFLTVADGDPYVTMDGNFKEHISSPGASSGLRCYGGGCVLLHNPTANAWNVTASTADEIVLTAAGASAVVDIVLIGTT